MNLTVINEEKGQYLYTSPGLLFKTGENITYAIRYHEAGSEFKKRVIIVFLLLICSERCKHQKRATVLCKGVNKTKRIQRSELLDNLK